jgi:hypothetical protein
VVFPVAMLTLASAVTSHEVGSAADPALSPPR